MKTNLESNSAPKSPAALKKRNIIAICIAVVILIIGSVGGYAVYSNTGSRLVEKQLSLGEKYLSELNYEAAIVAFTKVIGVDPRNVDAYIGLSEAYVGDGRPDEAATALHNGLTQVPDSDQLVDQLVTVQTEIGQNSMSSGDFAKAAAAYQDIIKYKPEDTEAYIGLAGAYTGSGDMDKANSAIESAKSNGATSNELDQKLAEINKKSAVKLISDGEAYLVAKDYNNAVTAFKRAIELQADNAEDYLGMADAYLGLGDTSNAINTLTSAIAKIPNSVSLYSKLTDIYISQKDYQKAADILQNGVNATGDAGLKAKLDDISSKLANVTIIGSWEGVGEESTFTYTFYSNGMYTLIYDTIYEELKDTVAGSNESGNYTISGNTLSTSTRTRTFKITTINGNKVLVLDGVNFYRVN